MKELSPDETLIEGQWLFDGKEVTGDEACERIKWLVENILEELAVSKQYGAWETLYKDQKDNRKWVHYYPQGEMQGGGPPALKVISHEEAHEKFNV